MLVAIHTVESTDKSKLVYFSSHPREGFHPVPKLLAQLLLADPHHLSRDLATPQPDAKEILLQEAGLILTLALRYCAHGLLLLQTYCAL